MEASCRGVSADSAVCRWPAARSRCATPLNSEATCGGRGGGAAARGSGGLGEEADHAEALDTACWRRGCLGCPHQGGQSPVELRLHQRTMQVSCMQRCRNQ